MGEGEQGISFAPEQKPQKERLSEEKLGGLLAAIGNHEGKALLLASMKKNRIYTRWDVHTLMMENQGDQKGWVLNEPVTFGWCKDSLHPIGLVALEVIDQDLNTLGYMKTDYGDKEGTALAGHLLAFSEKHPEISLYKLFGSTSSSSKKNTSEIKNLNDLAKKRAPLTRLRILNELTTSNNPLREADIAAKLHERYPEEYEKQKIDESIQSHIRQLAKAGIITYDATTGNESSSSYSLSLEHPNEQPPPYRTHKTLTNQVYALLKENPNKSFAIDEFCKELSKRHPQLEQTSERNLQRWTSSVLSHLAREGYSLRGKFDNKNRSEISLTDSQRGIIVDLQRIGDNFSELDERYLEEGRRLAYEITSDSSRTSALMEKAKIASPQANKTDRNETAQLIAPIIESKPCTIREIQQELEKKGKKLTPNTLKKIMSKFSKQEGWIVTKENNVNYYAITANKPE